MNIDTLESLCVVLETVTSQVITTADASLVIVTLPYSLRAKQLRATCNPTEENFGNVVVARGAYLEMFSRSEKPKLRYASQSKFTHHKMNVNFSHHTQQMNITLKSQAISTNRLL